METHSVAWKQTEWPEETVLREKLYGDRQCDMVTYIVVNGNIPGREAIIWRHTIWHGNIQSGQRKQS